MGVTQQQPRLFKMDAKDSITAAQQIVALDTRYNVVRPLPSQQYKLLYIRRRNQLLQENARQQTDSSTRLHYLKLRQQILSSRYGPSERRSKSSSRRSSALHSLHQSMESLPVGDSSLLTSPSQHHRSSTPLLGSGLVPTTSAQASRAMAGDTSLSEHYAFCGMQHIFDQHRDPVTVIKFANNDKTRLACGSRDGTLSVFSLEMEPPSLSCCLRGHRGEVNDFDWSMGNDSIISASSDGTCRLWNSLTGVCLREIPDSSSGTQLLSCCFHTQNSNLLIAGNSKGQVKVYNASTGKIPKGGSSKTAGAVLSLALDPSGAVLWATDSKGSMFSFHMDAVTGKLQRSKRIVVCAGVFISSISSRSWISREARDPSLLLSCADSCLRLYRITADGNVYLKRRFPVPHSSETIRSAFCPLMSFLQGACVVSGAEDGRVYLYDVETGVEVNTLQGHSCPVLDVSWSYDESLLASCDAQGTVILWKREQNKTSTPIPSRK